MRVDRACTLFVAPHGKNHRDGRSLDAALRTPSHAIKKAAPGDVICFARGRYPAFYVRGFEASAQAPLVLRALKGHEREAVFGKKSYKYGVGILLEDCAHVHLYELAVTQVQAGVSINASSHIRLEGMRIESVGQAGIRAGQPVEHNKLIGKVSHHIDIIGNTVRDTGKSTARYGEGVYLGTGGLEGGASHHMFVAYNRFERVRAEAIEIKAGTSHHLIRGNLILDSSHIFHGAITVAVQAFVSGDVHALIEDNIIYNYAATSPDSVAGISVGKGNTIVRGNLIWGVQGGRGIRTTTTFTNQQARRVLIERNTIWHPHSARSLSAHDGDERTGVTDMLGLITAKDNLTDDGTLDSIKVDASYFRGPLTDDADAGDGAGSGFEARAFAGKGADVRALREVMN